MPEPRVAILGAGIMGASTALFLARRGARVTLFDQASSPLSGASRWNEGKIHLGFLYAADDSLGTARRLLSGGLSFKPVAEELIGCSLDPVTTPADDLYLCHRDSVVPTDRMESHFAAVAGLVREHPDASRYLVDVSGCQAGRLDAAELARLTGSDEIVAGFRVPERSVSTTWVADRFVEALSAEPRVERVLGARVLAVGAAAGDGLSVETSEGTRGPFDHVVNALWEGKLAVDATIGMEPPAEWSHRYRLSLFVRTGEPVDCPSAVIAAGPFGDVKNYGGRDFYLSWYPKGLLAQGSGLAPPEIPALSEAARRATADAIFASLEERLPLVHRIRERAEEATVAGGWVFAAGTGSLADPQATLHRRDDFGVRRLGRYVSVDTGKYSTAPWLAREIAASIVP